MMKDLYNWIVTKVEVIPKTKFNLEKLKEIFTELDARESSNNSIYPEYRNYSRNALCEEDIKLLKEMEE